MCNLKDIPKVDMNCLLDLNFGSACILGCSALNCCYPQPWSGSWTPGSGFSPGLLCSSAGPSPSSGLLGSAYLPWPWALLFLPLLHENDDILAPFYLEHLGGVRCFPQGLFSLPWPCLTLHDSLLTKSSLIFANLVPIPTPNYCFPQISKQLRLSTYHQMSWLAHYMYWLSVS